MYKYKLINRYKIYGRKILININLSRFIGINLVSKPCNNIYISYNDIKIINPNMIIFLSTTKGIITYTKTYNNIIGGLYLFNVICLNY